jgi:dihydrofolate reductase
MKLIIACDVNGGIGYKNKLPWDTIKGDLTRFKELTSNGVVVMGRNTWESLPKKPLPNRLNFVVTSKQLELPLGAINIPNLDHFTFFKNAWLIGGAQLVNSNWNLIDEVYLTTTYQKYTCDVYINLVKLEKEFYNVSIEKNQDHTFEIWRKR